MAKTGWLEEKRWIKIECTKIKSGWVLVGVVSS